MSRINSYYQDQSGYYYPQNTNGENPPSYYYKPKSRESAEIGWVIASIASGLVYKLLPSFSNPFLKQMTKEHSNNHLYMDVFNKAVIKSELKEKGLKIINDTNPTTDIGRGYNACFVPATKEIRLNQFKASISGFHELGHAMNNMNKGFGNIMQKLRKPGMVLSGIMASVALLSRNKPKGENRDFRDFVQDNCGKIAFIGMLPTVIEETMASYKGVEAAKKAGLTEPIVKNLKKFYGKALLSYGGYALVTGCSVFVASKIMELFTRPKKVEI